MRKCITEDCKRTLDDDDEYPFDLCVIHRDEPDERVTAPMTVDELKETLGMTIKRDDTNKVLTFLAMATAYTGSAQMNVSFRAPSSTGKSYIPLEIATLFPDEDVIEVAYASPTAFFHDRGEWDEERQIVLMDLSRKVLVFVDMPHDRLLHRLRPVLSHDRKELTFKITDKKERHGLRTKNVVLRGYPAVVFCTASMKMDEQESTRNLLLSPETTQEKLREAIQLRIKKSADSKDFNHWLKQDSRREILKARIHQIKKAGIDDVIIPNTEKIEKRVLGKRLKPRDMRDVGRLMSLVKALALLNLWHREQDGDDLIAADEDIEEAFKLWDEVEKAQGLGIPPYIFRLYEEVIEPIARDGGVDRPGIMKKHLQVYGKSISNKTLSRDILPHLEAAGLIYQEKDPDDKRKKLVYLTDNEERNIPPGGGVNLTNVQSTPPRQGIYPDEMEGSDYKHDSEDDETPGIMEFIHYYQEEHGELPTISTVLEETGKTEEDLKYLRKTGCVYEPKPGRLGVV